MSLKNILLTGSIKAYPSQSYGQKTYISSTDEQSFPIETITGSDGGTLPVPIELKYTLPIAVSIHHEKVTPSVYNISMDISYNTSSGYIYIYDNDYGDITGTSSANIIYEKATPLSAINVNLNVTKGQLVFRKSGSTGTSPTFRNLEISLIQGYVQNNESISGSSEEIILNDAWYNGEFSGSNLTVVTQSLNNCNIFFDEEVNYIPILYRGDDTLFTFQSNPNYISEAQFLLPENSPEQGEIYLYWNKSLITQNTTASGIIWIKINRFDSNGVDHTIQLEQLEVLRIKYNNGTIANFVVNSITEYLTYYLYEVTRNNTISTADNEIKDYKVSVLKNTIQNNSSLLNTNNAYLGIGSWNTPLFNMQGYFDSSSGHYTQGNLSNIDLIFTASVQISSSLNEAVNRCSASIGIISLGSDGFYYPLNLNLTSAITPLPQFSNVTITLTGIISASYLSENSQIQLGYRPFSVFGAWSQANISAASLTITQSVNPQTGSLDLTILEPYVIEPNFYNGDCNPLINNALTPRYDNFYMDVDYTDQITAENREAILSNTAPRAQVQPYYYELAAQINPRYVGTKNYTYNEEPSLQTKQTYFAAFDWIGASDYEILKKANFHISYLVDEDGNATAPGLNTPFYNNLIDNFNENGNEANVILQQNEGTTISPITGLKKVIKSGALTKAIIVTQTGSTNNYFSTMSFSLIQTSTSSATATNNFIANASISTTYTAGSLLNITGINGGIGADIQVNTGPDDIEILTSTNTVTIKPSITINGTTNPTEPGYTNAQFTVNVGLIIEKWDGLSWVNFQPIQYKPFSPNSQNISKTWNFNTDIPIDGNKYRARIDIVTDQGTLVINSANFKFTQAPLPGGASSLTSGGPPTASYWQTGSVSKSVLTGTAGFNSGIYGAAYQDNVTGSGGTEAYFNNLLFEIKRGDQIRFEGDENQTYLIYSVIPPGDPQTTNYLYLFLDRDIINGTNLNSFIIRRFNPDPNFIILDTPAYISSKGFLLPKNPSDKLLANFNTIIQNLTQKGLI